MRLFGQARAWIRKTRFWAVLFVLVSKEFLFDRWRLDQAKRRAWPLAFEFCIVLVRAMFKAGTPQQGQIAQIRQRMAIPMKLRTRATFTRVSIPVLRQRITIHEDAMEEDRQQEGEENVFEEQVLVEGEWVEHPRARGSSRVLFYLHGGGYCLFSSQTHRNITSKLSKATAAKVLAIDYRLAPENPFPAALEDSVAVYKWLLSEEGMGMSPTSILIGGDSAGGGLSLATICYLLDHGLPLPLAAICISPWVDLTCSTESWQRHARFDYLPPISPNFNCAHMYIHGFSSSSSSSSSLLRHPYVSPLHAEPHHHRSFPPLLIQVGELEMLHDEGVALAAKAPQAARLRVYPSMVHVFQGFGSLTPMTAVAMADVTAFVEEVTQMEEREREREEEEEDNGVERGRTGGHESSKY
ncbi:Alpha/beta hydrolase [Balamuthia mandrillaris]